MAGGARCRGVPGGSNVEPRQVVFFNKKVLENAEISRTIRKYDGSITEVNPTYTIVMKHGVTEQIIELFRALDAFGCVFQYTRSGRIAVTRDKQEQVSEFLEQRENERDR